MKGFVYVLSNKSYRSGLIKIGQSGYHPAKRAKELSSETSVPEPFRVEYCALVDNFEQLEKKVHEALQSDRNRENREFFNCPIPVAIAAIKEHASQIFDEEIHYQSPEEIEQLRRRKEAEAIEAARLAAVALKEEKAAAERHRYETEELPKLKFLNEVKEAIGGRFFQANEAELANYRHRQRFWLIAYAGCVVLFLSGNILHTDLMTSSLGGSENKDLRDMLDFILLIAGLLYVVGLFKYHERNLEDMKSPWAYEGDKLIWRCRTCTDEELLQLFFPYPSALNEQIRKANKLRPPESRLSRMRKLRQETPFWFAIFFFATLYPVLFFLEPLWS